MNQLDLTTQDRKLFFRPGEWIEGRAEWQLDRDARSVEVRLIWFTRGKGDTDVSVLDSQRIDAPARSDSRAYRFRLPEGPYSFSGKLISLVWAIELVAEGIKEAARLEFTLSPDGREIELGSTTAHLSPREAALQQKAVDLAQKLGARPRK